MGIMPDSGYMAVVTIGTWATGTRGRGGAHRRALASVSATEWPPTEENSPDDRYSIEMSSSVDGLRHKVPEEDLASRAVRERGVYRAICGRRLVPLPMICPQGPPCTRCEELRPSSTGGQHRRRTLAGRVGLLHRRDAAAG